MAHAGGSMFQELSSRLASSQDNSGEQTMPTAPVARNSPQLPAKPPLKPPVEEKTRSNTTGKSKTVRISVEAEEDKRQTIGAIPEGNSHESSKKKHGVWKGIKRFFGKKKDRKAIDGRHRGDVGKEHTIGDQMRAKSESELPNATTDSGKDNNRKMKNVRSSWSEGLEKSDSQKSTASSNERDPSSPGEDEHASDKLGIRIPKKIRDSFRNRFKLKRRKSDVASDSPESLSVDGASESDRSASGETTNTNFFDDSFYTASLSPITEVSSQTTNENQLDELPDLHNSSLLSPSDAAKHKMNVAPKARRKPARFRNRKTESTGSLHSEKSLSTVSSTSVEASRSLKESMRLSGVVISEGSIASGESVDGIVRTESGSKSEIHTGMIDGEKAINNSQTVSTSLEQLTTKEPRKPIPVPRPRPKSLGPGLLTGEPPASKEPIAVEVTVTRSPATRKKALPALPQSKSASDVASGHMLGRSSATDKGDTALVTGGGELVTGGVEVTIDGINPTVAAVSPSSGSGEDHRAETSDNTALSQDEKQLPLDAAVPTLHANQPEAEQQSSGDVHKDQLIQQTTNNSAGEYVNFQHHLAKHSDFARKHPPPDTSINKISSPKLQRAAEVSAVRFNVRTNSDAKGTPSSPIYEQPEPVKFQKRQWSSLKTRKTDIVDFRSIDIEEDSMPARSYSVSSKYESSVPKGRAFDVPAAGTEQKDAEDNTPDWIKIARMKHKRHSVDGQKEDVQDTTHLDVSASLSPANPSGLLST